ncbi:class I SAM-dependent methyltransferase [Patescibacteria group bacterium]
MTNKISGMYSLLGAKWYDPFKKAWNFFVGRQAEKDLEDFMKKNISEYKEVLELGCGTALNLEKIYNHELKFKSYLGLDFTEAMLEIAGDKFKGYPNVDFKHKDITQLDLDGPKYDTIICTWVMSHLKDPINFTNNAQKLLKPGGEMFLIFYTKPKWYVEFWFGFIAEKLFFATCFDKRVVQEFKNVQRSNTYALGLSTTVIIKNPN